MKTLKIKPSDMHNTHYAMYARLSCLINYRYSRGSLLNNTKIKNTVYANL